MDKFDQVQKLHRIFLSRRFPVPLRIIEEELQCSRKTARGYIETLRDQCLAPLLYDETRKGWHYDKNTETFQLPGLWLTAEELQSLVLVLNLLDQVGHGLLSGELAVVRRQIMKLLENRDIDPEILTQRFKVLSLGYKTLAGTIFNGVSEALLRRRQIRIHYVDSKQEKTRRTLSPQRLFFYRENWYVDAWCHSRKALRTFSIPRIQSLTALDTPAKAISQQELTEHFEQGYGLFAGPAKHTAHLRFLPAIAPEIAAQRWHPEQTGSWDGEEYLLSFPYSKDTELVSDILRHVPNVTVEGPSELAETVRERLEAGLAVQRGRNTG